MKNICTASLYLNTQKGSLRSDEDIMSSTKDIEKIKTLTVSFVSIHDHLTSKKLKGISLSKVEEKMLETVNNFFNLLDEGSQPLSEEVVALLKELVSDVDVNLHEPLPKEDEAS